LITTVKVVGGRHSLLRRTSFYQHCGPGLPLSFWNWVYVRQGTIFGRMVRQGIDFRRFHTQNLRIFGVILGLLETSKMYKLL